MSISQSKLEKAREAAIEAIWVTSFASSEWLMIAVDEELARQSGMKPAELQYEFTSRACKLFTNVVRSCEQLESALREPVASLFERAVAAAGPCPVLQVPGVAAGTVCTYHQAAHRTAWQFLTLLPMACMNKEADGGVSFVAAPAWAIAAWPGLSEHREYENDPVYRKRLDPLVRGFTMLEDPSDFTARIRRESAIAITYLREHGNEFSQQGPSRRNAHAEAYRLHREALNLMGKSEGEATCQEVHTFLKEHLGEMPGPGKGYRLPALDTFRNYVSKGKKAAS